MSPPRPQLPLLGVADFGPTQNHVAEAYLGGKVFAILERNDTARTVLSTLSFPVTDDYTHVFVHGGEEVTRFENMTVGTHEIPEDVVAQLLKNEYGTQLSGMRIRMCTCYGNMRRPGDAKTLVQQLAGLLPQVSFEGYHGLVLLEINPPRIRLGRSLVWDAHNIPPGPVIVGPPGPWEVITP